MDELISRPRRRWRVPVWGLMIVPVACAPLFLWLANANRMTPAERAEQEYRWVTNPLGEPWPKPGEDELFKLTRVVGPFNNGRYYGLTWWITPDGMLHDQWHSDADAGGGEVPAPPALLAQLPTLLKNLPPSDPAAVPTNRVMIALPVNGYWEVRTYRREALPKVVSDLVNTLKSSGF